MNAAPLAAADCFSRSLLSFEDAEREEPVEQSLLSRTLPLAVREAWSAILDRTLLEWGRQAKQGGLEPTEDDIPPTPDVITEAYEFAGTLRDHGLPSPKRIYMDGDGGVVFKFAPSSPEETISVTICGDGEIEVDYYQDGLFIRGVTFPGLEQPRSSAVGS